MSLFERLKSAVKGNPVLREYDLGQQIASAGPGLFWRVYQGVKKTTRKASSHELLINQRYSNHTLTRVRVSVLLYRFWRSCMQLLFCNVGSMCAWSCRRCMVLLTLLSSFVNLIIRFVVFYLVT